MRPLPRRRLLAALLALPWAAAAAAQPPRPHRRGAPDPPLVLQESPLAGFQYHAGAAVWGALRKGQPLQLRREPHNAYDERAVAVYWRTHKLGYLPRVDNAAAAQLLDRGAVLRGRIVRLRQAADPWRRVRLAVELLRAPPV